MQKLLFCKSISVECCINKLSIFINTNLANLLLYVPTLSFNIGFSLINTMKAKRKTEVCLPIVSIYRIKSMNILSRLKMIFEKGRKKSKPMVPSLHFTPPTFGAATTEMFSIFLKVIAAILNFSRVIW